MTHRTCALLCACALAAGCDEKQPPPREEPPPAVEKAYKSGAAGLRELWTDILVAAQKDERGRVHDLMASMIMTDDDLVALFGADRGAYLKPRYAPMIARLVNIGAMELVAQIADRKYDDIEVFPVEASQGPEQKALLESLKSPAAVFGVRVKKKTETRGLRYDFFVYRDARWVTGNQLAKYLVPEKPAATDGGANTAAPMAKDDGKSTATPASAQADGKAAARNDGKAAAPSAGSASGAPAKPEAAGPASASGKRP